MNLTENITILDRIIVAVIIGSTLVLSFVVYKRLKQNLKQQKINQIIIEINNLQFKLSNAKDEKQKVFLKQKVEKLKKEKNERL